MSNIFDALRKKQGDERGRRGRKEGLPFQPQGRSSVAEHREIDFKLTRELEALRERIELELPQTDRRVFGIAASTVGEGATTVGLHLGQIIARTSEAKVLLIDGDLTGSPRTLSRAVGPMETLPGLAELLAGSTDLSKTVLSTDEPNLHFLPAGRDTTRPLELLSSGRMREFLEDMGQLYGFVIVDCPPILEHPEAPVLGALTEGMLLVVRAHRTRREVVQRALALLQGARCRVLGVVLNRRSYPIPDFLYRRL